MHKMKLEMAQPACAIPIGRIKLALAMATVLALFAQPTLAATSTKRSATGAASATILTRLSTAISKNLSAGALKTSGSATQGTVTVPPTFPLFPTPPAIYVNASILQGEHKVFPNAARIDVTGTPKAAFSINVQGWTQIAGRASAKVQAGTLTYYSPSNSPMTVARGVFDAQGKAAVYVGAAIVIQRDNSGDIYTLKPIYTVSYN